MKNKGFTLLEVIIAVSVLTIAVGGTYALISQTLRAASLANSRLVAAHLAQEGVEIVRNFRDNNWLNQRINPGLSWKAGLGAGEYEADYNDAALVSFAAEGRNLYIDASNGFYTYLASPGPGDTQTKFKRKIIVAEVGDDEIDVTVRIFWQERGGEYAIEVVEELYNWYGY